MENFNTATTTLFETNESPTPAPCEGKNELDTESTSSDSYKPHRKGIPLYMLIIVMMTIMLVINAFEMRQYKQYSETIEHQAYVLSVSINLLEDNLLFNYHVLPQDIGFEELRSAWIDNPCYETAKPYYDALKEALEYLDGNSETTPNLEPIEI